MKVPGYLFIPKCILEFDFTSFRLGGKWKAVFHDAVCGKDRSFEARYGVLQEKGSELEVVLQYVEEKEKMDGAEMLPKSSGESSFFNVLEWISFSRVDKGTY